MGAVVRHQPAVGVTSRAESARPSPLHRCGLHRVQFNGQKKYACSSSLVFSAWAAIFLVHVGTYFGWPTWLGVTAQCRSVCMLLLGKGTNPLSSFLIAVVHIAASLRCSDPIVPEGQRERVRRGTRNFPRKEYVCR